MNAKQPFVANQAQVDEAAIAPLPNSRKIYVEGSRADLRVPMREIRQADTPTAMGGEQNPPIFVYDCSGPYTDPAARIDIRSGLPALRQAWIEERGDTEVLPGLSSEYGRVRAADARLDELRKTMVAFGTVKKGTSIQLNYVPGSGIRTLVEGAQKGPDIQGEDFYAALLKIWLGKSPADNSLKTALLGGK